jgi:hypothetical protein
MRRQVVSLQMAKSLSLNLHAYAWGNEDLHMKQEYGEASTARARNCRRLFTTRPRIGRGAAILAPFQSEQAHASPTRL